MTPIDFQGQGSKVKVTRYTVLLNLVNMIQTEPFKLGPSNLVHILLMKRGWHLLISKVRGQRSRSHTIYLLLSLEHKVKPFYIANYDVIFLLDSPVGRILQRLRWSCCSFRAPDSSTGPIQMKSSMTFIQGNRCIEREKDNFKTCSIVKC